MQDEETKEKLDQWRETVKEKMKEKPDPSDAYPNHVMVDPHVLSTPIVANLYGDYRYRYTPHIPKTCVC